GRVDVDERRLAAYRHVYHRFAVKADEVPCSDVTFDGHQLGKEAPRPQDGIAALAFECGHHDQGAAIRIERIDQTVDQFCVHTRHVAETYDGTIGIGRNRRDARLQGRAEALREFRVIDEAYRQPGERSLDLLALMAGDHNDWLGARSQRRFCSDANERPAPDLRKELVWSAHACGSPCRQDQGGDTLFPHWHRFLARLRACDDLHQKAANAHAGNRVARHRQTGKQTHEHPVESIFLGRTCTARRAQHWAALRRAQLTQLAWIDRHDEKGDAP